MSFRGLVLLGSWRRSPSFASVLLPVVCLSFALCLAPLAKASPGEALAAHDWQRAALLAEAAIAAGGQHVSELSELYKVLGIARAQLGDVDLARRAFTCALALDPSLRLASDEAVEVRSPFMEARGFWSLHAQRLNASAELSDDGSALIVALVDPAALAARVLVRARATGQRHFVEYSVAPASTLHVALETLLVADGIDYTLALIDDNANRLWELGSDIQPIHAVRKRVIAPPAPAPPRTERVPVATPQSNRPYYIAAAISFVVSAGAIAVAGVSHAERQRLAARWNDADCDGMGTTRGEVCSGERAQITHYERLAMSLYAVGGVALAAGIVTLIAAPSRAARERASARGKLQCNAGPGVVGVACRASF